MATKSVWWQRNYKNYKNYKISNIISRVSSIHYFEGGLEDVLNYSTKFRFQNKIP